MRWNFITCFIAIVNLHNAQSLLFLDIIKIIQFGASSVYNTWQLAEHQLTSIDSPVFYTASKEERIIWHALEVNKAIEDLKTQINFNQQLILHQLRNLPKEILTGVKIDQITELLQDIEITYQDFMDKLKVSIDSKKENDYERITLEEHFLHNVSPQRESTRSFLDKIHFKIVPQLDSQKITHTSPFLELLKNHANNNMKNGHRKFLVILELILLSTIVLSRELTEVDTIRARVINQLDNLREISSHSEWQYIAKHKNGLDAQLMVEFGSICQTIDNATIPEVPTAALDTIWTYSLISLESNHIKSFYNKFKKYQEMPDPLLMADSWIQFAEAMLNTESDEPSAYKSLAILQEMIYDENVLRKSLYRSIVMTTSESACELKQSPQQLVFNMFTVLQLVQLKAYTMIQTSWMMLRAYDKGNFTNESKSLKTKFLERLEQQAKAAQNAMKYASNEILTCDPPQHINGKTYDELTKFMQGFIVNEVDLNNDNTCTSNCAAYKYTTQKGCFKNQFCAQQPPCRGKVIDCKFVDSDMYICQSYHNSQRRYEWIQYENGRQLGMRQSCKRAVNQVDSWWRWLVYHCSYCFCYCDDEKDRRSDRYFSLKPVVADTSSNMVVTGARFIKLNRVFYLQIQQGKLLPGGMINGSSVAWKDVEEININDPNYKVDTDYYMLTWDHRAVDLDDLKLLPNQVLTGLKFRRIGGHLNFEIQGTQFNYTTGKLSRGGTVNQWISNDNTDVALSSPRFHLRTPNKDVPSRYYQHKKVSNTDSYLEFSPSDDTADAAQSTVPYIDTQPLAPSPATPLVGAGLILKGTSSSGGFLSLSLSTYNYSPHIQDFFPQLNEAEL